MGKTRSHGRLGTRERMLAAMGAASCAAGASAGFTPPDGPGCFNYTPIEQTTTITDARFHVDLAAFNGSRDIGGIEVNYVRLINISTMGTVMADLSDDLFGAIGAPGIMMGPQQTQVFDVGIDPAFFPALHLGTVGMVATFTDTVDAAFAIDFMSLVITTSQGVIEATYGTGGNNGFGIGVPDNAPLPGVVTVALPHGTTNTGFDETVTSKSIKCVPAPGAVGIGAIALAAWASRRREGRAS